MLIVLALLSLQAIGQQMLVENGRSNYVVVLRQEADSVEWTAARTLQHYVSQATGVTLPILLENDYRTNHKAVFLGKTRWTDAEIIRDEELRDDGFLILSDRGNMYIFSFVDKGILYGVYHLLEHYLDMRFFAPHAVVVPHRDVLPLPRVDVVENPSFAFRDVLYYYPNHSQEYADFHRLHNSRDLARDWGMFVHTFRHLVPQERFFDLHPEWFSEVDGRRVRDGQLCLSNPEVLEVLCHSLDSMMRLNPEAKIWSVSNNDNYNVCTCEKCRRMDKEYGGPSGTLVHFINQVAERFPDKVISTLGYQFTRQAPQSATTPRNNVNIMFCSIECGRQESVATAPREEQFRKDMREWAAKTDNIFMWDYVGQFRSMWSPFPNLHVLQPNLRFFHDNGVRMMFEQGTGADNKTSWMELRTYLIAKLMWNVDADVDSLTDDFCRGYYGAAAEPMRRLYDEMHRSLVESGQWLNIYGFPTDGRDGFLSQGQMDKYRKWVGEAYRMAEADSAVCARIRYWEMALDYADLEIGAGGDRVADKEYLDMAEHFVADCHRFGVENLMEMGVTPDEYLAMIKGYADKLPSRNLAYRKRVKLVAKPDKRYAPSGAKGLTDGVVGHLDYNQDWSGFYGKALDATIDLGRRCHVEEVQADFFFYPLSWIFLPERMEVYVSANGRRWELAGSMVCDNPEILARPEIRRLRVEGIARKARYVRLVAQPLPHIPEWHRAVGKPCWIFCDEIVVR